MMRLIKLAILGAVIVAVAPFATTWLSKSWLEAQAQPSWARKYKADCTLCHTTYPRLNRTGYEFRRLGYRLPQELEGGRVASTAPVGPVRAGTTTPNTYVVERTGYTPRSASAESERGKGLFASLNCASCHAIGGKGGHIGPLLDGVGARRDETFLTEHLTNPEEHVRKHPEQYNNMPNQMPHPHMTVDEVRAMVAYLVTLPEPPAGFVVASHNAPEVLAGSESSATFIPAVETDATRAGRTLYFNLGCAACHSIQGTGGQFGPALDGIGMRRSQHFLVGHISNPPSHAQEFPGEHMGESMMPPTDATPEQIETIADFLMTLAPMEGIVVPGMRLPDYIGVFYAPAIGYEREDGVTTTTYEKRDLVVFAAGPLGRNFSFFVQPLPVSDAKGFGGKFEIAQGLFNAGGRRSFVQVRFGQLFTLHNAGFAGTDRGLTDSVPFIFEPVNGFEVGGLGRGVSLEYTYNRTTTVKVFGSYNEPVEADDPATMELKRSRCVGLAFEKVIGERGLSGVQFEFATGRTPYSVEGIGEQSARFQRYAFFANKSFVDGKNFERLNAIFGLALLRDDHVIGLDADARSRGYGYFFEVDAIPVAKRLSCIARYDRLRPTTLVNDNALHGVTLGVIYDPIRYARISFEYQHLGGDVTLDHYRIGWQFNF